MHAVGIERTLKLGKIIRKIWQRQGMHILDHCAVHQVACQRGGIAGLAMSWAENAERQVGCWDVATMSEDVATEPSDQCVGLPRQT